VATSTSKSLFATSCKSSSPTHASVRINDINNNHQLLGAPLEGHSLTVTRIAFRPPDDESILTVSRDRTWKLFRRREGMHLSPVICRTPTTRGPTTRPTDGSYTPAATDKSHSRIIWDCAWSSEGDIFATASRDKTVRSSIFVFFPSHADLLSQARIWHSVESNWTAAAVLKVKEAATAVAFSPIDPDNRFALFCIHVLFGDRKDVFEKLTILFFFFFLFRRRLAVGIETGQILIYSSVRSTPSEWTLDLTIDSR
jgi:elongator complex protein 2